MHLNQMQVQMQMSTIQMQVQMQMRPPRGIQMQVQMQMPHLHLQVQMHLHLNTSLGHTKFFPPDGCFGLLKRAFKRHAISSLSELDSVVKGSACVNSSQLVGEEDGTSYVLVADWQVHLAPYFRPFPGIKKYQHFRY